jgi:hypothetical protein
MDAKKRGKALEADVQAAIECAEFDNLKGRGKTISLDAYFDTPEELLWGYSFSRAAGFSLKSSSPRTRLPHL